MGMVFAQVVRSMVAKNVLHIQIKYVFNALIKTGLYYQTESVHVGFQFGKSPTPLVSVVIA